MSHRLEEVNNQVQVAQTNKVLIDMLHDVVTAWLTH